MRIAVLGGTGPEGLGIAARLAAAGESVIIGSRSAGRATEAVAQLRAKLPQAALSGRTNPEAAAAAEVVFVVVPYGGLEHILSTCAPALAGKVVVDTIVPLRVEKNFFAAETVSEGSAGGRLQAHLPSSRVVSAFKHQSAADLIAIERPMEGDVLLCGNDAGAKELVTGLIRSIPRLRPIDAGDLRVAGVLEAMTALLLNLNRRHKARTSYRIIGL